MMQLRRFIASVRLIIVVAAVMLTIQVAVGQVNAIDLAQVTLPEAAQRVLTSRLTVQWKPANRYFYKCNLNGDSLPDYAFMVSVGEDPCLVEYYVALIAEDQSYAFHVLAARPSSMGSAGITEYVLRHKGEKVPNYEDYNYEKDEPTWFELRSDAIEFVPSAGCCAVVNVFRGGVFKMFTSSD